MKTMKTLKYIVLGIVTLVAFACEEGIDPISAVAPGPDESAPQVVIKNPSVDMIIIPFTDESTAMDFEFEATDDIELQSVSVSLNGSTIATFDDFKDYRRAFDSYAYEDLPVGDHTVVVTATDLSGKETSADFDFTVSNKYQIKYEGEKFYMPFEGDLYMDLVTNVNAGLVGTPGFTEGKMGKAYSGSTDEYLTFSTDGLLGEEFSAAFWYKVNAVPDRSGILTIGPPDPDKPATPNNRKNGFRLFRENAAGKQRVKLNVGNGTADNWFDGGPAADIDPAAGEWVHIAFTISASECTVYLDGEVVSTGAFAGVDWTGCDILSIASGAPRFTEWSHLSDHSLIDELRLFNKALTQEQVKAIITGG
jgi:hypothetical protein